MDSKVLDFLTNHRVSSLTTLLKDGTPHGAALHYSHKSDPLTLYFSTENTSRKCQRLLNGESVKAAVVIGHSEEEWLTLQMEGEVKIVPKNELEEVQKIHYKKLPSSEAWKNDPTTVILAFTPTWWRFTDLNTEPYTILSSE
jgi:general stress protein 26